MPTVPTIKAPTVDVAPADNTFLQNSAATPDAFGAGVGRAVQELSDTVINQGAAAAKKVKDENDERDAKRTFLDYSKERQELERGFLDSEGTNTLDSHAETVEKVEALGKKFKEATAGNRRVSDSVGFAIDQDSLQFRSRIDKHHSKQKKVVDDELHNGIIIEATNEGIEEYKTFGADSSQFDESFDGDATNAFDDRVRVNENAIRRHTEDKARKDGDIPGPKVAEAVSTYYDSVVRAAVANGDSTTALRIFNGSRDKVIGDKGIALKNFLKDQTTNDVALTMARKIYEDVSHLPLEQRLGAGMKEVLKVTEYDKFASVKTQFESLLKTDGQIKALEVPSAVRETVMGMLAKQSPAKVALELNKIKDPVMRDAALGFLESVEKINKSAKKETVEDFVGQIYRMEDDNLDAAKTIIKKAYKDDPKAEGIALAHLKSLADVDESLLKTDLASQADKSKKEIIEKVRKTLPAGASVAEQKASAILEAENIKDPKVKLAAIAQLNSFYSSLEGFDTEQAQDAGVDLIDKVSKTGKTGEGKLQEILKSDANSKTKNRAIALMTSIDTVARRDEKVRKDEAASTMSAAMANGMSPSEFRASSPENAARYDIVSTDGPLMSGMVSSFRLAKEGQEFPFVSHKSAVDDLRKMSEDELVRLDPDKYRGRLSRADTATLDARKRGAVAKRKTENARVAASVTRNINRLQPYNKKGKPKLTKGVLAKVDNYVWTQIADAQKKGEFLKEEDVKKMVIAAFTVVEFSPDDPGFFESVFGLDRGGDNKDVAGALISEMSEKELNTLRVDEDNFPPEMSRFLDIAVDAWKRRNPGLGEPEGEEMELLRGNVLKFVLKNRER